MEPNDFMKTQLDSTGRRRYQYFQPGDLIAKQYQFVDWLGQGGMGKVCLCKDTKDNDREVALKMVPDILKGNADAEEALHAEYRKMLELTHDGIVAVRYLADDEFRFYVVMDYAKGETLEAYLKNHRKPDLPVVQEVVRRLAAALDYAHGKNMVHRDVKPANVMVEIDKSSVKSVKLLDFGLGVQIRESVSHISGVMSGGTPAYKAPEQWRPDIYQGKISAETDLYALGAVAYEMLQGSYPFSNFDLTTFPNAVLTVQPPSIDGLPPYVNTALQKALAKKPEDRFSSCMAFAKALAGDGTVEAQQTKTVKKETPVVSSPKIDDTAPIGRENLKFRLSQDVELELVYIPAGTFMMGIPEDEYGREDHEQLHQVTLTKPFWIGKYPVTQAQYKAVTGTNPANHTTIFWGMKSDNPVEMVSWNDAINYCELLNKRISREKLPQGYEFTLPTEAQWEYACRAGTTTPLNRWEELIRQDKKNLYNIDQLREKNFKGNLDTLGWYNGNSDGKTHPVGLKKPNTWGLYDMHGNVWEWCLDWFEADYAKDPEFLRGNSGKDRVLHGGSKYNDAAECASGNRGRATPVNSFANVGFRVALAAIQ